MIFPLTKVLRYDFENSCVLYPQEHKCNFKISPISQNNCKIIFQCIILNSSLQIMVLYDVTLT